VIRFRPAAARELAAEIRYYEKHYGGRGKRFLEAVQRVLSVIAESPLSFPVLLEPDIRSAKVVRFPYRVVYVVIEGDIDVVAVAHAKRRPDYWRRRAT
jgi:plasmid stabilization system protein ParE